MEKKAKKTPVSTALIYIVLSFWALTTIYPFIWVILNSFRKKGLILSDSFSLPLGDAFTFENYIVAWQRSDFKNAYLNSFLIARTTPMRDSHAIPPSGSTSRPVPKPTTLPPRAAKSLIAAASA